MNEPTTFETVRMYDPEVVSRVSPEVAGKFAVERDVAVLKLPPEAKPVIFRCRTLTRSQRRIVQEQSSDERKYELAFRFGVLEIRNLPGPNGPHTWAPSRQKPDAAIEDEAIDATGLGDTDLWEIGSVVYARSFLALGTPLRCPQLPSSLHAWTAVRFQSVEPSQGSETPAES